MELAHHKRAEIAAKATSLDRELSEWLDVSVAGGVLEKHHSQIRTVVGVLERVATELVSDPLAAADDAEQLLREAPRLEFTILALHRVWDFFRAKLALRFVPWFQDALAAADELAWDCYEPASRRLGAAESEPPLVFLNGDSSPFTLTRGSRFPAEEVPGEPLDPRLLHRALDILPVPVIGVPWFQVVHLLDAPVIGHEVGHDVERDLDLGPDLDAAIVAALGEGAPRRAAWRAWRAELFADVYGTLATGPAFASTMIDFLAGDRDDVVTERIEAPRWGAYPTRTLRVLVCTHVLRRLGFSDEPAALEQRWSAAYASHAMTDFEPDLAPVIDAMLDGPHRALGGAALTALLTFTPAMHRQAQQGATAILAGRLPPTRDVRATFAAARIAYERDPARYAARDGGAHVLRAVRRLRAGGTRADQPSRAAPRKDAHAARDDQAARRLVALLEGPGAATGPFAHLRCS